MPLSGRALRFVLVAAMMDRGEMTVAEMVTGLDELGHRVTGRASKVISDALRWEVRRGRVQRVGRGRYRFRRAPTSTARRIQLLARRSRQWLLAVRAGHTPPLALPDPRQRKSGFPWPPPNMPPWGHLGWLWVT